MVDKRLMTIEDFVRQYSISRTSAYREATEGRLKLKKVGSRSYISLDDAEAWVEQLETSVPALGRRKQSQ